MATVDSFIRTASLSLLMLAAGCGGIHGSGVAHEETRVVPEFTGIQVHNGLSARITVGSERSVRLDGDDNLLPLVRTTVQNGRLVVEFTENGGYTSTLGLQATVTVPRADFVGASGGSRVIIENIAANHFTVDASGGSTVTASGGARELQVDLSGGTTLQARELIAEKLQIDASGGSTANVHVSTEARGSLSGGSRLTIMGGADTSNVSLSGDSRISTQ
jgi:hypothetical protein